MRVGSRCLLHFTISSGLSKSPFQYSHFLKDLPLVSLEGDDYRRFARGRRSTCGSLYLIVICLIFRGNFAEILQSYSVEQERWKSRERCNKSLKKLHFFFLLKTELGLPALQLLRNILNLYIHQLPTEILRRPKQFVNFGQ